MAIFNSYVSLPEGTRDPPMTSRVRDRTWDHHDPGPWLSSRNDPRRKTSQPKFFCQEKLSCFPCASHNVFNIFAYIFRGLGIGQTLLPYKRIFKRWKKHPWTSYFRVPWVPWVPQVWIYVPLNFRIFQVFPIFWMCFSYVFHPPWHQGASTRRPWIPWRWGRRSLSCDGWRPATRASADGRWKNGWFTLW